MDGRFSYEQSIHYVIQQLSPRARSRCIYQELHISPITDNSLNKPGQLTSAATQPDPATQSNDFGNDWETQLPNYKMSAQSRCSHSSRLNWQLNFQELLDMFVSSNIPPNVTEKWFWIYVSVDT